MHGIGYIGEDQLREAFSAIADDDNEKLKIVVGHHHLIPVNKLEIVSEEDPKVSIMLDSRLVTDHLLNNKVSLYLHGHQHTPFYSIIRRTNDTSDEHNGKELMIFASGSLSVQSSSIDFFKRNHYNIYTVTNRYIETISRFTDDSGHGFTEHKSFKEWLE